MTPNQAARAIPRLNGFAARHALPLVVAGLVRAGGATVLGVFYADRSEPFVSEQVNVISAHLQNLTEAALKADA